MLQKVCGQVVLSAYLVVSGVELDGPGMRTVPSEDQVVLEAGLDGPVMHVGWDGLVMTYSLWGILYAFVRASSSLCLASL